MNELPGGGERVKVQAGGCASAAVAFGTWAYALTHTNAGKVAATTPAVPAIAVSWIFLGEVPTALGFIAGALGLAEVVITRRSSAPSPSPVAAPAGCRG